MKKFLAILLASLMVLGLVGCSNSNGNESNDTLKAGFIFLHDENSTYDLNFINAAKEACEALGIEYVLKTNIPEGQECYDAAMELVDEGCNVIFADSFGHEDF
ncbi:MAG: BMP family ABC transporter substrate-binding protein, partial [Firmicutes bacterium]|nr:BMP family ABC transporter substrate-binding protein [Bacillota bacterium]